MKTLIAAVLSLAAFVPTMVLAQEGPGLAQRMLPPSIVVVGRGEVSVRPDRAVVSLGATARAKVASEAQSQVNAVVSKALEQIKALGIPEAAIQTSGLSIYPVHGPPRSAEDQEPRITGYQASNTVTIRVDDLSKVGAVIDAGVGAGANQVQGVSFSLKDDMPQKEEALQRAAKQARAKAQAIATAMGVTLGPVHEAMEEDAGGARPMVMMERASFDSGGGAPVQPGEVEVEAALRVRFRIAEGGGR